MNLKSYILENLPSILTGVAVAGVVETVYLAVKATPKALDILEERSSEEKKDGTGWNKADTVKATWKCYIPAAIAGAGTIACIVGANYAHLSREAGMLAAYSFLGEKFVDYRERSGEKHDVKIMNSMKKDHISEVRKPDRPLEVGKMWVYEPESKQYFQATTEQILWAELTANKIFHNQGWLSFNQFLDLLPEAERVDWGDHTGWYIYDEDGSWDFNWSFYRGGTPWIDIQPQISEDDDVMVLAYGMHPGDCPDPQDIEEPEQYVEKMIFHDKPVKGKCVVVKHS